MDGVRGFEGASTGECGPGVCGRDRRAYCTLCHGHLTIDHTFTSRRSAVLLIWAPPMLGRSLRVLHVILQTCLLSPGFAFNDQDLSPRIAISYRCHLEHFMTPCHIHLFYPSPTRRVPAWISHTLPLCELYPSWLCHKERTWASFGSRGLLVHIWGNDVGVSGVDIRYVTIHTLIRTRALMRDAGISRRLTAALVTLNAIS